MNHDIEVIRNLLTPDDAEQLKRIHAPVVVETPLFDSRRDLCVMPDGEIRGYGFVSAEEPWRTVRCFTAHHGDLSKIRQAYLASRDGGLSWKRRVVCEGGFRLGACVKSPWSNRWLTVYSRFDDEATYAFLSVIGPDDTNPRCVKMSDATYNDMLQPVALRSKNRWVCAMQRRDGHVQYHSSVWHSDDDGESWGHYDFPSLPLEPVKPPHKGSRWINNGSECSISEFADGTLALIIRTSFDFFWISYSYDHGDTWTPPEQSVFHGTLTTPFLLHLSDGRELAIWNNTRPLPEVDHANTWAPADDGIRNGVWEDFFTNRDAAHAAISGDNGKTWSGFREILLNPIRNNSDFRSHGGNASSNDKSVHQFQAIELPFNKVLVSAGQNQSSARLLIFDIDWLLERGRIENLQKGLSNISTHAYVKSPFGDHWPWVRHCALNRTEGPLLVMDPEAHGREALQICRPDDDRLVCEKLGVVWNFPATDKGEVEIEARVEGEGARLCLCDHWINPTDETAAMYAACSFDITPAIVERGKWLMLRIAFGAGRAELFADGVRLADIALNFIPDTGISYLHIQSLAGKTDMAGILVRSLAHKEHMSQNLRHPS